MTIDEIKNKYENQPIEHEENDKVIEVTKSVNDGVIRVGVGLKKAPKKRYILGDIFGKDYEINHNTETINTISTIGKAMQKLKGDDQLSKVFGMLADMFYVIFVNKQDAEEIMAANSEFTIQEQIENSLLIIKSAMAVMSNKSIAEIDSLINNGVSEEQKSFREDKE